MGTHSNVIIVIMEKNYRLDILKVKQKIFNSYPENSQARKLMLKKEQLNELNSLTIANTLLYSDNTLDYVISGVQEKIQGCLFSGIIGIMLILIMFGAKLLFPITSGFGLVCFYSIAGILGLGSVLYFREMFHGLKAISKTRKARKDMKDRIKELKNKIFGDL